MDISAKLVLKKMDEEMAKLKQALNQSPNSSQYRESAQALKTYCNLLLDSELQLYDTKSNHQSSLSDEAVKHAMYGDLEEGRHERTLRQGAAKKSTTDPIYDEGDRPSSDSLFDF
ncbi:DUF5327 family protein [Salipaludibacillus agaradhaerens]|uniref:YwdI family protein n=1 Tax=Salipaludibacillus agaradhaerens TaxID=76935 RepID=UPI0021506DD8|nr:YwdI family protein [Salipaludibacillus agaradhaerens]MCR6108290.1 DUF5327 family protein [Salipaludibacillus agaradhaerens]MCR6120315.1 DUF5327 family protein [Salipaludibacillus agaradhaerens]